ncbi:MAG: sulfotransferase domain-containing protein [Flavobacteriales bacterium]|nr:sulfotransferase domain-containing protein [Flavobacteriales bacterium]
MAKINFIGIGTQKAGTSWLAEAINEHPDIYIHPKKEAHFFNREKFYINKFHYERTFKSKKEKVIGEITPAYISEKKVAKRIFQYNSGVKLIAILRDPTERAVSQYKMEISRGTIENNSGLWDEFERDLPRYGPMKERGLYKEQLDRFYKYFNKNQILIMKYKDLKENPISFIKTVFEFLEVESTFIPNCINTNIKHKKDTSENLIIEKGDIEKVREYYSNYDSLLTTES